MADNKLSASSGDEVGVALIGAGVMSATLDALFKELEPSWSQVLFERLDQSAKESSSPWNNASIGHSALCELNYMPEKNSKVDVTKAKIINKQFQVSRQLWTSLTGNDALTGPKEFINPADHTTLVQGPEQVAFTRRRYETLEKELLLPGQEPIEDPDRFAEYPPLMPGDRNFSKPVSAIRNPNGADVNFGALTKQYLAALSGMGTETRYGYEVTGLKHGDSKWIVTVKNLHTKDVRTLVSNFVFVGADGDALSLLQKARINETRGLGGFPVSGQWLRCTNEEVIAKHDARVYGKASVGTPPMSVPHLDTHVVDGKRGLLFGPCAGWNMKFLKNGNNLDLIKSLCPANLPSMIGVGAREMGLTKYPITEVLKDFGARIESLREHVPNARPEDWELVVTGQRVQVIKPMKASAFGTLKFGIAVINSQDGTTASPMDAPPDASTALAVMISLIERCFGRHMGKWVPKLKELVPSYGIHLADDSALFKKVWEASQKTPKLER